MLVSLLGLAVILSTLVSADKNPYLEITSPSDGDFFTDPGLTVEGWANHKNLSMFNNFTNLGAVELAGLSIDNDGTLILTCELVFAEEFEGDTLDTDKWNIVYDDGFMEVVNGKLRMVDVKLGNYHWGSKIASKGDVFSIDPKVSWTGMFSIKYGYQPQFNQGGGITGSTTFYKENHVSLYYHYSNYEYFDVYSYRTLAKSISHWDEGYIDIVLKYDATTDKYHVLVWETEEAVTELPDRPTHFWFGTNTPKAGRNHGEIFIDYARLWTQSGSWTSRVMDMNEVVSIDGLEVEWNSTRKKDSLVDLYVKVSNDNETWSKWTPVVDGVPADSLAGRYLQYRLDLGFNATRSKDHLLSVDGIRLHYHIPLERVEFDPGDGTWIPATGIYCWTFSTNLTEDENLLRVRVVDVYDRVNETSLHLVLDTTPPTGTILLNGGNDWINDTMVIISVQAEDRWGVMAIQVSNDPDMLKWTLVNYTTTLEWRVPPAEGELSVYARFIDTHGLVSNLTSDSIKFDSLPPDAGLVVEGDAEYTSTRHVTLELEIYDRNPISLVELANNPSFQDGQQVEVGTIEVEWDLGTSEDGWTTVYLRVTDIAGNSGFANDSITLYFPKALGSVRLSDGANVTGITVVSLEIFAPPELRSDSMQVSNVPTFPDIGWESYATEKTWIIDEGDGERIIYVRFMDFRGIPTLPVNVSFVLDTTPPSIQILLNDGMDYTTMSPVSVEVIYEDSTAPGGMQVSSSDDFTGAPTVDFLETFENDIPEQEGEQWLFLRVSDTVGNWAMSSASIHYATIAPLVTLTLPNDGLTNAKTELEVQVGWTDPYGEVMVQLSIGEPPDEGAEWRQAEEVMTLALDDNIMEGDYKVYCRAQNVPGLIGDTVDVDVTFDWTPPNPMIESPEDGSKVKQGSKKVKVAINYGDDRRISRVDYRVNGEEWIPLMSLQEEFTLEVADWGEHSIEVRVADTAGNEVVVHSQFELIKEVEDSTPGAGAIATIASFLISALIVILVSHGRR
jgi:ASC-1-like (ASCH) protein